MPSPKSTLSTLCYNGEGHTQSLTKYVTRVVDTSRKHVGVSSNWKLDYYKFKNMSFAQVLKKTIQNQKSNKVSQVPSAPKQHPINAPKKDVHVAQRNSEKIMYSPAETGKSTHFVKANTTRVTKVSPEKCLPCKNRFQVLTVDNVVESSSDSKNGHEKTIRVIRPNLVVTKKYSNTVKDEMDLKIPKNHINENQETDQLSKYDIPITTKSKSQSYKSALPHCATLRLWDVQNKYKFGFIPLGNLCLPHRVYPREGGLDSIAMHHRLKHSKANNFMGEQIPIKSQLNPDAWERHLQHYWDKQLPLLVRFGFPLDYDRGGVLKSQEENHTSAKYFPEDIKAYLNEEISHGAIVGPFKERPIDNLHVSPMMTRDKPNAPHRRVIIDLSFPQGLSVNAGVEKDIYLQTPFILKLPTIDNITDQVKSLGRGCKLYKVDISRAFRHIKLDPSDYDLLGLRHDAYYVDTCLRFGYRNGSALFQRISDAVRHMMRQRQFDVINYIDDILGIDVPSKINASFDALCQLLDDLGFQISQKKLHPPTTQLNCLGIVVDTVEFTVSIPTEKLQDILDTCCSWRERTHCNKKQLQSLLGSLLYISKCVRTSRFFLNRLLDVLRAMEDKKQTLITVDAKRDINWFIKFLPTYNGVTFFDYRPVNHSIELDASLQGLGARWGNQVYAMSLPLGYLDLQIAHLEMLNILAALRVWQDRWKDKKVAIACDNWAVVQVLNIGRTRDLTLAAIARNIQYQAAVSNIHLKVTHIPGKKNVIADLLSRWNNTTNPQQLLRSHLPHFSWVNIPEQSIDIDWSI